MTGAENQPGAALKDVKAENDKVFEQRLSRRHDELRWLYMELYGNSDMFAELCGQMKRYYDSRKESLKALDLKREKEGKMVPQPGYGRHDDVYRQLCGKSQRSAGEAPVY